MRTPLPDGLPERIRSDSTEALEALYRVAGPPLFALAYRLTLSRADAEDALHDLFAGLPRALNHYREQGRFEQWLKRLLVRTVLMQRRSDGRRTMREAEYATELAQFQGQYEDTASSGEAERLLGCLPEKIRAVVVLRELEGMSHAEIARTLGISRAASRVRLVRGLERLRRTLRRER
ncbi:MAG TPA: sigma-70 family RNA polymerase sigma factor [Gemmatimonadales bacterium]|nr:sigma-70 family RNA polymerase sigma factor [Gemmatimonadales bacterium]